MQEEAASESTWLLPKCMNCGSHKIIVPQVILIWNIDGVNRDIRGVAITQKNADILEKVVRQDNMKHSILGTVVQEKVAVDHPFANGMLNRFFGKLRED